MVVLGLCFCFWLKNVELVVEDLAVLEFLSTLLIRDYCSFLLIENGESSIVILRHVEILSHGVLFAAHLEVDRFGCFA